MHGSPAGFSFLGLDLSDGIASVTIDRPAVLVRQRDIGEARSKRRANAAEIDNGQWRQLSGHGVIPFSYPPAHFPAREVAPFSGERGHNLRRPVALWALPR